MSFSTPISNSSQAQLVAQTDQIEPSLSSLLSLASAEGADIALVQAATANLLTALQTFRAENSTGLGTIGQIEADQLLKLIQIYGSATNSESALGSIDARLIEIKNNGENGNLLLYTIQNFLQDIRSQVNPLVFHLGTKHDSQSFQLGNPLLVPADSLRRQLTIVNSTGNASGNVNPIDSESWIFGSYQNSNPDQTNFDFVVEPGQQVNAPDPVNDLWLVCGSAASYEGFFNVVEYY